MIREDLPVHTTRMPWPRLGYLTGMDPTSDPSRPEDDEQPVDNAKGTSHGSKRAKPGSAVTTGAMSADPVPPVDDNAPLAATDPRSDPSGAARELRTASGGEAIEPDLAEVPDRSTAGIRAARFEIDVEPDALEPEGE